MAVTPEHLRSARLMVPWLPLPAVFGFALFGVGGSLFLAYTAFDHGTTKRAAIPSGEAPVYEARAVPFDAPRETAAQRAASIARALTVTQTEVQTAEAVEVVETMKAVETGESVASSYPLLLADSHREMRGFSAFGNFAGANNYLALTGSSFGIAGESMPSSGFMAPDAETITSSVVPEASTWMCGGALFVLVAARGAHARWHRKRRRN